MVGTCPRCGTATLRTVDDGRERCSACAGTWLDAGRATTFAERFAEVDRALLADLAAQARGGALPCPRCRTKMTAFPLKGIDVDRCPSCKGMWFDDDEMLRVAAAARGIPMDTYPSAPASAAQAAVSAPRPDPVAPTKGPAPSTVDEDPAPRTSLVALGERTRRNLARAVGGGTVIEIHQEVELGEVLLSFEAPNRYAIKAGATTVYAKETSRNLLTIFLRLWLRRQRPLHMVVTDADKQLLFRIDRPFYFFFSTLKVTDPEGAEIGRIEKRFGLLTKKYDLFALGQRFARIASSFWKIWKFPVVDDDTGTEVAVIQKQWSGLLKEIATDADHFAIDLGATRFSLEQRAVLVAAALSVDLDYFENTHKKRRRRD